MRLNKQEEEDSEVKDIFEASRKTTRVTQNNDNYESDDDADEFHVEKGKPAKGSRAKSSMQLDEDDFDNETTVKPARGRGLFLFG